MKAQGKKKDGKGKLSSFRRTCYTFPFNPFRVTAILNALTHSRAPHDSSISSFAEQPHMAAAQACNLPLP
jgi:hypothetical protein